MQQWRNGTHSLNPFIKLLAIEWVESCIKERYSGSHPDIWWFCDVKLRGTSCCIGEKLAKLHTDDSIFIYSSFFLIIYHLNFISSFHFFLGFSLLKSFSF